MARSKVNLWSRRRRRLRLTQLKRVSCSTHGAERVFCRSRQCTLVSETFWFESASAVQRVPGISSILGISFWSDLPSRARGRGWVFFLVMERTFFSFLGYLRFSLFISTFRQNYTPDALQWYWRPEINNIVAIGSALPCPAQPNRNRLLKRACSNVLQ